MVRSKGPSPKSGGEEFTADPSAERTQLLLGTPPQTLPSSSSGGTSSYTRDTTSDKQNEEERLRLLLVEGKKNDRGIRITHGAAKLLGKWPTYVASAIWGLIFIVSLITLLSLLVFMLMMKNFGMQKDKDRFKLKNEFCRRVTEANKSLMAMGYADGRANPKLTVMDATNNIYFLETKPLTLEGACALESALRLCPDKSVFILNLGTTAEDTYEHKLKAEYTNLHTIKTEGGHYFAGSPFEGRWSTSGGESSWSLLAAEILTVWQYGGAVLSDNLILYSRRIFDHNEGYCEVDRQLLFCPDQCAAFVYEMLETAIKSTSNTDEEIVVKSLSNFCGGGDKYVNSGCVGVHKLKQSAMCDTVAKHCTFIRMTEFKAKNPDWKKTLKKFCPLILI